jgi:DNA-binding GntR family transcriptional regulator
MSSEPEPVAPDGATKADWLTHALEELILTGELAPGTVLRQDEISRRFDVSRTPVREAFRQLTALGLVSFSPNRGVRVRTLDRDQWRQASIARAALEGLVAELAAVAITPEQLAELDEAAKQFADHSEQLRSGITGSKREQVAFAWIEANERFHKVIVTAAGAPFIGELIDSVRRVFSGHTRWRPGSAADRLYEVDVRQHTALREALAAGNPDAARALATAHVLDSWRLLEEVLDEPDADPG